MQFRSTVEKMQKRERMETNKRKDSKRGKHSARMEHQKARRQAAQNHKPAFVFSCNCKNDVIKWKALQSVGAFLEG